MNKVEYTDYIVNVANAILELGILKNELKTLGKDKITAKDLLKIKTTAEVYNITDDNMIAILAILAQIDSDNELRKRMSLLVYNSISNINEETIQNKVKQSKDSMSIAYDLAILDSYMEYLDTGEIDEAVISHVSEIINTKIKVRMLNNLCNKIDFYEINKQIVKDSKYKENMSNILNSMNKEQLVNELIIAYKTLNELN